MISAVQAAPFRYRLNGWAVASDLALPFLVPDALPGAEIDVHIRRAPVPPPPADAIQIARAITLGPDGTGWVEAGGQGWIMVPDGRHILVDTDPDLPPAILHTWLCGAALSILSHRRGQPPLHACVVAIRGRAVALSGHSGAGKSTTAAALLRRGHGLVSDDQAIIDPDHLTVAPGYPSIKLWGSAAAALGIATDPDLGIGGDVDKFHIPLPGQLATAPVPLSAIVMVRPDPAATVPSVQNIAWPASLPILHNLIHWRAIGRQMDGGKAGLALMGRMARSVPFVILTRPQDLTALDRLADRVEALVE